MTPTLPGRLITRVILSIFVGIPVALLFVAFSHSLTPLINLFLMIIVGLFLDVFYQSVQNARWDADWPILLMLGSGVIEFFCMGGLLFMINLYTLNYDFFGYGLMFWIVWGIGFLLQIGPISIFDPYRKFKGGRF